MNGNGLSAGDIMALTKDRDGNAFDWSWIIGLLVIGGLFGGFGGGFGWGNRGAVTNDTLLGEEFIKRDIFNTNQNVSNTSCQTQRDVLESRYNTQLGFANASAQAQACCCETQKEILQNRYDNALQTQTLSSQLAGCCCNLETAIHAEGEATRNQLQQDKIDQLREQVNATNLALNNANLANQIITSLRPYPQPSYLVSSPYSSIYNPYNGCGCNSSVL